MKLLLIAGSFCLLYSLQLAAQQKKPPTADDLQKMQDEIMQKVNQAKADPRYKKYFDSSAMKNQPVNYNIPDATSLSANMFPVKKDSLNLSKIKLPPKDNKAIALIPAKPLTKPEVVSLIADLKKRLIPALQGSYGKETINTTGMNAEEESNASLMAWCKGSPVLALSLAIDAAQADPDDDDVLNNLSGILTMCGIPYKAIPILDYIKKEIGDNSTVDNNLGQAWVSVGDADKAIGYLKQATAGSPNHPNANMTLAYIYYARGDKETAANYCEECLKGAFFSDAWSMLLQIRPKARLMDYVRHRYKQTQYFNWDKYPLLPQCTKAEDVEKMEREYREYHNMLIAMKDKYERLIKEENSYVEKNLAKTIMAKVSQRKNPMRPFGIFASAVLGDIGKDHAEKVLELNKYDKQFEARLKEMTDKYNEQVKQIYKKYEIPEDQDGEGGNNPDNYEAMCADLNTAATGYMTECADITDVWQKKWLYAERDYFNDFTYWAYVASLDDHSYNKTFYMLVEDYLTIMGKLTRSKFVRCKSITDYSNAKADSLSAEKAKCPLNAEIPIANLGAHGVKGFVKEGFIGKISIDCENFGVEFGEGLIFNLDRNMATHETTLAFGLGFSKSIPIVHLADAGAKMQFYVTLESGIPSDIGMRWEAEMDIKGMNKPEQKAGYSIGLNSGIKFVGEGQIVEAISDRVSRDVFGLEPDHQVNPNVKLYNNGGSKKE